MKAGPAPSPSVPVRVVASGSIAQIPRDQATGQREQRLLLPVGQDHADDDLHSRYTERAVRSNSPARSVDDRPRVTRLKAFQTVP